MKRSLALTALVALLTFTATTTYAAVDPGVACAVAKQKAAAKKLVGMVKCHATAIKKGEAVDAACLPKAETKFDDAFAKADGKGGCVISNDAPAVENFIDDTVLAPLLTFLSPPDAACAAAKLKAAAKALSDKIKCNGVALKKGEDVDPACISEAEGKLAAKIAKADAKGSCVGDAATINASEDTLIDAFQVYMPPATTTTTSPPPTTTTMPLVPRVCSSTTTDACWTCLCTSYFDPQTCNALYTVCVDTCPPLGTGACCSDALCAGCGVFPGYVEPDVPTCDLPFPCDGACGCCGP